MIILGLRIAKARRSLVLPFMNIYMWESNLEVDDLCEETKWSHIQDSAENFSRTIYWELTSKGKQKAKQLLSGKLHELWWPRV